MGNYIPLPGVVAGESMTTWQFKGVKLSAAADRTVLKITNANTERPIGILQNDPASGEAAEVAAWGVCKAMYGDTVTRGQTLAFNNSGLLIADAEVIAQTGADLHHVADALESGAVNEVHQVLLHTPTIVGLE